VDRRPQVRLRHRDVRYLRLSRDFGRHAHLPGLAVCRRILRRRDEKVRRPMCRPERRRVWLRYLYVRRFNLPQPGDGWFGGLSGGRLRHRHLQRGDEEVRRQVRGDRRSDASARRAARRRTTAVRPLSASAPVRRPGPVTSPGFVVQPRARARTQTPQTTPPAAPVLGNVCRVPATCPVSRGSALVSLPMR